MRGSGEGKMRWEGPTAGQYTRTAGFPISFLQLPRPMPRLGLQYQTRETSDPFKSRQTAVYLALRPSSHTPDPETQRSALCNRRLCPAHVVLVTFCSEYTHVQGAAHPRLCVCWLDSAEQLTMPRPSCARLPDAQLLVGRSFTNTGFMSRA
jgi:hypothetical protein